ncbi:hypothetical protein J4448_03090 [Candidatus Woesearchaeota archaeon]|nr:hypothetical protein [Candidatus Woesearchaeota archaeon]
MSARNFLKPSISKILIFLFIGILFLYFANESACGISFFFAFCYKAYGFPLAHLITGDIANSMGYIKTLPFGQFFYKSGNLLFNPAALLIDISLIYLLACLLDSLFRMRIKKFHSE